MSDQSPQKKPYPLRMPDEMRAELEECASTGGRSLNAEIVARLEQSLGAIPDEFAVMRAISMLMEWGKARDLSVAVDVRRKDDNVRQITADQDALPKEALSDYFSRANKNSETIRNELVHKRIASEVKKPTKKRIS